ncbi:hypothetical protein U1Q18_049864, partial [Sarracenia purpurea var. burkii]
KGPPPKYQCKSMRGRADKKQNKKAKKNLRRVREESKANFEVANTMFQDPIFRLLPQIKDKSRL